MPSTELEAMNAGRSAPGLRQAVIRAAAAATPQLTRQALFQQAGMIATANLGELLDATALLASQPVPTGRSIGVVSNTRGGYMLAADACGDAGLQVATLTEDTQRALRDLLPPAATVAGPVDTTAVAGPGVFRRCLELVGADPGVDAVLALTATTAAGDLVPEVAAVRLPVPVVTTTAGAAAAAAAAWPGVPVALKADVPDLAVHRKGAGAVLLDLHGADEVRRGFRSLEDAFGDRLTSVIIQPMITGGVEVTINVLEEQLFGPVVLFGLDGAADVLADRSARLAP